MADATRTTVSKWLAGERTPDRKSGYLLERELGIPIDSWDEPSGASEETTSPQPESSPTAAE